MHATSVPKGFVFFPEQLHWTSQQLAEAVPLRLRLHEIFSFDIDACVDAQPLSRADFAPRAPLADRFSVR